MIIKFKYFLKEAKIRDIFNNINKDNNLNNYSNLQFKNDEKLIDIIVTEYMNKILNIEWFHDNKHDIIDRIKNRTNYKSISEWNINFEKIINELFNKHFNELNKNYIKYNLYVKDENYSIIANIDFDNLFENNTIIEIKTIISGLDTNVDEIIEINI